MIDDLKQQVKGEDFSIFYGFAIWLGCAALAELARLKVRYDLHMARHENAVQRQAMRRRKR
ncbi:MAG: hypothetical protein ACK4NZ_16535 [Tsuneonella sp.]